MLNKIGSSLKILKTASSSTDVLVDAPMTEKSPGHTIIEPKHSDFLYYRARAISAGDQGPIGKDGKRGWNYNGNFDFFSRKELEASYDTFRNRNIFLDHNSESSLYSIGKIIDAVPVDDPETGEFYIELVGKIDRTLHPEICRKIETGELNSTSMGCSVDESKCSICGHVLHSDADDKCDHLSSFGLGKKFQAEINLPEYNIKQGDMVPAFSINSGIVFNEDSIVGVPADPSAVIKTVLSNMKSRLTKKASLSKEEQLDLAAQMEKLFEKLDETTKISLKAEFCGICPPVEKESSMADKNVSPNEDQKKILSKLSALEMEQLESYVAHKTKKANEIINKEVVANAASKEETFLSKIVAKVKNSFAAELLEKKIETVAKEELRAAEMPSEYQCDKCTCSKHPMTPGDKRCTDCRCSKLEHKKASSILVAKEELTKEAKDCRKCGKKINDYDKFPKADECKSCEKKSSISAKFQEDKNNVLDSTWSVNEGDTCVLEASLKDIWGSTFETLSFDDQKWATSEAYGKEVIARYQKEGLEKLADLWDVTYKLSKTAKLPFHECPKCKAMNDEGAWTCGECGYKDSQAPKSKIASEPKLGPSGTYAKPTTGLSNKKHDYPTTPKFTDSKPGANQKGPAAPAHQDMKVDYKLDMPGQEKGQTGPAAHKPMDVKTDYSEPKPEAEGKEVKTTPKNPEEKKHDKSEKEVKTDYVAEGTEVMEAEEKGSKKEAAVLDSHGLHVFHCQNCNYEGNNFSAVNLTKLNDPKHTGWVCPKCNKEQGVEKKASVNYKEANAQIKWSALSGEAQEFIKKHVEKHIKEDGMERAQAVAAAYAEARKKGFEVPSKASSQETIMQKKAADKPEESVEGSTLPEGKKSMGDKVEESVQGTTVPGGAAPTKAPETSTQGDKEHKTLDLTKAPEESVQGTTLPKDHISNTEKSDESTKGTTFPDGKKSVGDESEQSVKKASADIGNTGKPEEAVEGTTLPAAKKTMGDKAEQSSQGDTEPKGTDPKKAVDEAVKKEAATEMPVPEDHKVDEVPAEHETESLTLDLPVDGPKVDGPKEEVSAFDSSKTLDIGEGYSAHKDHESKEIIVSKDGKEVKRLPDGFGKDAAEVLKLMKAVLGLPAEEAKSEVPGVVAPKMEEHKEEAPKVEEHPALEEAHEDELGIKESALKAKEAELLKKEAALKAKEDAVSKEEATKKFASVLKARSERCQTIVSSMVDKGALKMDQEVYDNEIHQGTYLLDARKKAIEAAISIKHKELLAMDDMALKAMEKAIEDLELPVKVNAKKASKLFVSPQFNEQLSEDEEIAKIFNSFGTKNKPQ